MARIRLSWPIPTFAAASLAGFLLLAWEGSDLMLLLAGGAWVAAAVALLRPGQGGRATGGQGSDSRAGLVATVDAAGEGDAGGGGGGGAGTG
ncbi:hypothetical protein [Falsiroseomonas selenitidurans]|uniref:Uncharacterized protein n=1 Tax=Falsiroseomonas selenitidurans TaxID=2716335 RepID=A0ABX1DZR0_9PROT|nr:hypothetical protein [Falsiroseomonas selenitidurans]NKC30395.1 hypothetical protein [Falsiroseomonas selenitidurans]